MIPLISPILLLSTPKGCIAVPSWEHLFVFIRETVIAICCRHLTSIVDSQEKKNLFFSWINAVHPEKHIKTPTLLAWAMNATIHKFGELSAFVCACFDLWVFLFFFFFTVISEHAMCGFTESKRFFKKGAQYAWFKLFITSPDLLTVKLITKQCWVSCIKIT